MRDVPTGSLRLEDTAFLSPPLVGAPLYQGAKALIVHGFNPGATLDMERNGVIVLTGVPGGFPQPVGALLHLSAPLVAGDVLRARQQAHGVTSGWSPTVSVRKHTQDHPDGPPRPRVAPAPVHRCGSRTGVANLLTGSEVWLTANGTEVARVQGAAPQQGLDVRPEYGPGQQVRAWANLDGDSSPPSPVQDTVAAPLPLPSPGFYLAYEGTRQVQVTNLVNGARFELSRNGVSLGTWRTWGDMHRVDLPAPLAAGDLLSAVQWLCPGTQSETSEFQVGSCGQLPAPQAEPLQCGDTSITLSMMATGATVKVYRNLVKAGEGGGPVVLLNAPVEHGDVVHVVQTLGTCVSQSARQLTCLCVAPHVTSDPSGLDLFPVGHADYDGGTTSIGGQTLHVRGTVYYPAQDDGANAPFHKRRGQRGPVPLVFMAHGNHAPADPSHLGYDYFQQALARMGFVAVSVDCNELNGWTGGPGNITDRADLLNASIAHFQTLNATGQVFAGVLDFDKVGLMGHSRGGEAVVIAPSRLSRPRAANIRCVLSLAPTDWGATQGALEGCEFLTLLPAADGDVFENDGAKYYDRCRPPTFKSQLYVHNACHNFFNRRWLENDNGGNLPTMDRSAHERVLLTYGCAFFRAVLAGHDTLGFLVGTELPPATLTFLVHLSFKWSAGLTVDDHEQGNTLAKNSLGQPTTQSGLLAGEYRFNQATATQYNGSFYGDSMGMVAEPGAAPGTFRSQLEPPVTLSGKELWIRVADVFIKDMPPARTGFQLGIELTDGTLEWVDSDAVGGVPLPFDTVFLTKSMLSTLRFPIRCFGSSKILRVARAIQLRLNRENARPLAFDDLQVIG